MRFQRLAMAAVLMSVGLGTTLRAESRGLRKTTPTRLAKVPAASRTHPAVMRNAVMRNAIMRKTYHDTGCTSCGQSAHSLFTKCKGSRGCESHSCRRVSMGIWVDLDRVLNHLFCCRDCAQKPCTTCRQPKKKWDRQKLLGSIFICQKPSCKKSRYGCAASVPSDVLELPAPPNPVEDGRGGPPKPPPGANYKPLWKMPSLKYRQATRPRSILVPPNYRATPLPPIGLGKPRILKISPHQTTAKQVDKAKSKASIRRSSANKINVKLSKPLKTTIEPAKAPQQLPIPEFDSIRLQPQTKVTPSVNKSKIQRISAQNVSSLRLVIPENPLRPLR